MKGKACSSSSKSSFHTHEPDLSPPGTSFHRPYHYNEVNSFTRFLQKSGLNIIHFTEGRTVPLMRLRRRCA